MRSTAAFSTASLPARVPGFSGRARNGCVNLAVVLVNQAHADPVNGIGILTQRADTCARALVMASRRATRCLVRDGREELLQIFNQLFEFCCLHTYLIVCIICGVYIRKGLSMARKTKEDAAKTRIKILKAALDLFSAKGFDRTTFEDIALRIKLTKGAVYWHFRSKPELLRQLIVYMVDEATGAQRIINSEPESFEQLRAGLKEWSGRMLNVPLNKKHFKMVIHLDFTRPALAEVQKQLKELNNGIFKVIGSSLERMRGSGAIREGVDLDLVKYALGSSWLGMLKYMLSADDSDFDISRTIDFMMDAVGSQILVRR